MAGVNQAAFQRFSRELNLEVEKLSQREVVRFQKKVALETFQRYLLRWPVDTGHLRANSRITIGAPAVAERDGTSPLSLAEAVGALAALGPFEVVYVTNTARHARVVDEGLFVPPDPGPSSDTRPGRTGRILVRGGYSTQAPQGVTDATVQEILARFP